MKGHILLSQNSSKTLIFNIYIISANKLSFDLKYFISKHHQIKRHNLISQNTLKTFINKII